MQQNPQNQDVSLQIKKLDNQILRRIHSLYGRRKALQLEPAGRQLQQRYSAIRQELERQLVNGFSPEELEQLRRFLARMQANL